jgi:DNA-binding MarR family transcriptional regulator
VVDCNGLENRRLARVREFESHRFRQNFCKNAPFGAFFISAGHCNTRFYSSLLSDANSRQTPEQIGKIIKMETNKSPFASAYLRFLQLARAVQALPEGDEMDANELALLEAVVLRWHEDKPMTVREAIGLDRLGSPATLHKRITRLREKDMLGTLNLEGDRRAKYLTPTQRSLAYFDHLGQSLTQVHQTTLA